MADIILAPAARPMRAVAGSRGGAGAAQPAGGEADLAAMSTAARGITSLPAGSQAADIVAVIEWHLARVAACIYTAYYSLN